MSATPWYATPDGMKRRIGYARREYRELSALLTLARAKRMMRWAKWLERELGRCLNELWAAQESLRTGVYLTELGL